MDVSSFVSCMFLLNISAFSTGSFSHLPTILSFSFSLLLFLQNFFKNILLQNQLNYDENVLKILNFFSTINNLNNNTLGFFLASIQLT